MKKSSPSVPEANRRLLESVCRALDEKKAGDLQLIDVVGLSTVTDYLIVATGLAEPHLRAMRIAVEKVLDEQGVKIASMDTNQQSGWLVVDAYQIMVHLFTAETRAKFALEQLWRDGRTLDWAKLGEAPKPSKPRKPRAAATGARRKPAKKA